MSKLYFTLIILFFSFSNTKAIDVDVKEGYMKFTHGKYNSLQVKIVGVQEKDVLKAWSKKMKKLKGKVKSSRHQVEGLGVMYYDIHHYPGNFYAKSKQNGAYVEFAVAVDLDGDYISSSDNMKAYSALKQFLIEFSKDVIRAQVKNELEAAQKALKKQQKEMEKLKKKKLRLKEHIVAWKEEIKLAENELIINDTDQKKQVDVIIKQQEKVEIIKKKQSEI
ncbi:MAG: 3-methyladenine DNA glycosylase AlkD [Saprospiraceae bacterium]|jgi:3-methyladenine DNA glycosylase AlkD